MRVYIDQANLFSFFGNKLNPKFEDCLRMLKAQCDLFFNFPKQQLLISEELKAIIGRFSSGSGKSKLPHFSDQHFPTRPLKSNLQTDFTSREDFTAVYLLDDDKVNNIKEKDTILIGGVGDEIDTLSNLFFEDFQFTKSYTPKRDMPTWESLVNTVRPCTDIIIVDRYLFANEDLLDFNLHALIAVLGGKKLGRKFNLVIFTCRTQIIEINGHKQSHTPDWDKLKKDIKTYLKKIYGSSPNVTIVTLNRVEEHDRTIYTNYYNSYSGDSLTYYDSKGRYISKGRNYSVHSHGLRDNLTKGFYFIDDMQKVINDLFYPKDMELFIGDKKCNFLKFPD